MAVRSPTVPDSVRDAKLSDTQQPIRTCIGCRKRAVAAELLRVVVAPGALGKAHYGPGTRSVDGPDALPVVPDPRRRAPGRGAWLHHDPTCVGLAERRRAFARALRVSGPIDPAAVREYVSEATPVRDKHNP